MESSVKIVINRASLKKGCDLSLPSFSVDRISKEQSDLLIDILLNEYQKNDKGGENANK